MSDYSYNDILRMQEEAKQRVIEMQKRSKSFADSFNKQNLQEKERGEPVNEEIRKMPEDDLPQKPRAISLPVEFIKEEQPHKKAPEPPEKSGVETAFQPKTKVQQKSGLPAALKNYFGNLSEDDTERMFILSLCLLLSSEKADDSLVLALMYLLN